jgi:hypothetical protein
VLNHTDTDKRDIVVMTVRLLQGPDTGYRDLAIARLFADYEQTLFTRVVAVAEREGRPVKLLVVPSTNAGDAIAQTAVRLQSTEIVVGESAKFTGAQLALLLGEGWDRTEKAKDFRSRLVVCQRNGSIETYQLGPHIPPLTPEDLELIHRLWIDAVARLGLQVHHRDVVRTAIEELAGDMSADSRSRAVDLIAHNLERTTQALPPRPDHPGPT